MVGTIRNRSSSRSVTVNRLPENVCAGAPLTMIARLGMRPFEASFPTDQPALGVTTSTNLRLWPSLLGRSHQSLRTDPREKSHICASSEEFTPGLSGSDRE